jgi:hypothetical protein
MTTPNAADRTALMRRQGLTESGFALATAVMLLAGQSSPGLAVLLGGAAIWMAWRGRVRYELADPLSAEERRELERLATGSRHVRETVALMTRAGQKPVRYDLSRLRRLARLESMIDGRA